MQTFSEHTWVDDGLSGRTAYVPFIEAGRVGFVIERDGRTSYVYLNASSTDADPTPNVFVYVGPENDPALDSSVVFVAFEEEDFGA
jgi:hypothetical protein